MSPPVLDLRYVGLPGNQLWELLRRRISERNREALLIELRKAGRTQVGDDDNGMMVQ